MKFRKSTKSSANKSVDLRPQHQSVPAKSLVAIEPPKKVIRALYDYQVPDPQNSPGYLSFSQGDFLHVVGRENDPDWYEACNPLHGTRGLVPVNFFEEIGKQAGRKNSTSGDRISGSNHDSGYAERVSQRDSTNEDASDALGQTRAKSMGRGNVAMIYGSVLYDFKAERPDELEARAGENIVVIAQSTSEWFIAKPITRLGGPGLIPVAFVEIRDTTTGQPVADVQDAVRKAGVPRVEEWKKMVADYKASSIPLGRLDTPSQGLNQSMERLNINGSSRSQQDLGQYAVDGQRNPYPSGVYQQQSQQSQQQQNPHRTSQMTSPVRAKVPGFSHHSGDFWFTVEAVMEDGRTWNLQRSYKDFYSLQLLLKDQFPEAAGNVEGFRRTLPYMPGPVPWVTENLTSERRGHLDKYIRDLLKIDPNITNSQVVRVFFYPRETDLQVTADEDEMGYRLSAGSHTSSAPSMTPHSSSGTLSTGAGNGSGYPNAQRQQPYAAQKTPPGTQRGQSGLAPPPPLLRNNSAQTASSGEYGAQAPAESANGNTQPVKVKVWFGDANCVIIRLAPAYRFYDLVQKLRDRWSLESSVDKQEAQKANFAIEYRDEGTQQHYRIESDQDLVIAKERNQKLTLRVAAVM